MRTRCTSLPSGPVWCVFRVMPIMVLVSVWTSSMVFATLTPPPLPRPPAWICAFTTTGSPSRCAIATASSALKATSPRGTGTPYLARIAFPWYSWIFTGCQLGRALVRGRAGAAKGPAVHFASTRRDQNNARMLSGRTPGVKAGPMPDRGAPSPHVHRRTASSWSSPSRRPRPRRRKSGCRSLAAQGQESGRPGRQLGRARRAGLRLGNGQRAPRAAGAAPQAARNQPRTGMGLMTTRRWQGRRRVEKVGSFRVPESRRPGWPTTRASAERARAQAADAAAGGGGAGGRGGRSAWRRGEPAAARRLPTGGRPRRSRRRAGEKRKDPGRT